MADLEQEGLDHDTLQGKQGDDPEMLYVKQQPTDREKQAENRLASSQI
jgi:hypothetical protein